MVKMILLAKQERHKENKCMDTKGEVGHWMNWEIDVYTQFCIK